MSAVSQINLARLDQRGQGPPRRAAFGCGAPSTSVAWPRPDLKS